MSRLEIATPERADVVIDELYRELGHRIEASPPGLCPIDLTRTFLEVCHAQSCGKCTPCRIGLGQLKNLIGDVLEGRATMHTLDLLEELSLAIIHSADCGIGHEAARMVYRSLMGFRDDYIEHIEHHRCISKIQRSVSCMSRCPADVDIPGYIALIREERYADAIRLIRKDNPFPTVCGYICEHPCEAHCRRTMMDQPVNIRGLKKAAADYAGEVDPPACAPSTGRKIAIVGGGPSGLTCAYYLQLMGHQTTIFETHAQLGGMLRYGIPNYRLPKDKLDMDINAILKTGVEVKTGVSVGKDFTISDLRQEYDAVVVAIGASTDKKLGMEHEDAEGIYSAVDFLCQVGYEKIMDLTDQDVCIVGGGNVSMDAVRTAIRMGARKVSIVYRRRRADMTALDAEIEGAIAEGVELVTLRAPKEIMVDENGHVCGLKVTPQMVSEVVNGRTKVKPSGEEDYVIPCTTLIVAIGQQVETAYFEQCGLPINKGRISIDKYGEFRNIPGVFAGGDCTSGPATVIKAVGVAKVLADSVDTYLGYHHAISCDVEIPAPSLDEVVPMGRVDLGEREACERVKDFNGCELCMSKKEATQEASRCLRCDHYGIGIFKGGRDTKW